MKNGCLGKKKKKFAILNFNTTFMEMDKDGLVVFDKHHIDKVAKDSKHKKFAADFGIQLRFQRGGAPAPEDSALAPFELEMEMEAHVDNTTV